MTITKNGAPVKPLMIGFEAGNGAPFLHCRHEDGDYRTYFPEELTADTCDEIALLCNVANGNLDTFGPAPGSNEFKLLSLAFHIEAMKGDEYLKGHPEWNEIAIEATALLDEML